MKNLIKIIAVAGIALVLLPNTVFAVWVATENFDSYSPATSLNGNSGGSNWTGNWAATSATSETAPTGMTGISGQTTGTSGIAARTFTSPTGLTEMYFRFRASEANLDHRIGLQQGGVAERIQVTFNNVGNIVGNGTTVGTYAANTTYVVGIKWGHNGTNYAISIDGGAYSSDIAINGGSTTIDKLYFDTNASASTYYYDDISVGPFVPVASSITIESDLILFGDW